MGTPADRIITQARARLGHREAPWGSNDDSGGWITRIQAHWGMRRQPWCNMATDAWYREAGVDDQGIQSPATAITASNAYRMGAVISYPIPGCLICWPGRHIGVVEKVYSRSTVGTIEGNTSDMVARRPRSNAGAVYIAPRALRQAAVAPPDPTRIYCFEDPKGAVLLPGVWRSRAFAVNARRRLGSLGKRARVTKRKGRWRIWMPREYRYTSRRERDADMALRAAQTGRRMRPTSRLVTTLDRSQVVAQGLGKTT